MLTKKKMLFAEAREMGKTPTQAAIYAGCPEKSADRAGWRYEKDKEILEERERIRELNTLVPILQKNSAPPPKNTKFEDPIDFLVHTMNDVTQDIRLRLDCAKQLLPYQHCKKTPENVPLKPSKSKQEKPGGFRPRAV